MKKTGIFAASAVVVVSFALGALAFTAGAHPTAHASGCTLGKESAGCKLDGTGYTALNSRLFVTFPASVSPKSTPSQLTMPGSAVCAGGGTAQLVITTKAVARIGGSLSFAGKAKVEGFTGNAALSVTSAKITAKLRITNAKKASLVGTAQLVLSNGSKCSKKLPSKLTRVLGG